MSESVSININTGSNDNDSEVICLLRSGQQRHNARLVFVFILYNVFKKTASLFKIEEAVIINQFILFL